MVTTYRDTWLAMTYPIVQPDRRIRRLTTGWVGEKFQRKRTTPSRIGAISGSAWAITPSVVPIPSTNNSTCDDVVPASTRSMSGRAATNITVTTRLLAIGV